MNKVFRERASLILGDLGKHSRIIEIGPSSKPLAPKADGWRTTVVDYADRGVIAARFLGDPDAAARVEAVDHVWRGGKLTSVFPDNFHGVFDGLIASHVIEHLPDLLCFFQEAALLIKEGGSVGFAVPDKRFCFDFFKPITTTGDVISAHDIPRAQHSGRTAFNDTAYSVQQLGRNGWGKVALDHLTPMFNIGRALAVMRRAEQAQPGSIYHDFHTWYFTPASFELLILELGHLGLIDWRTVGCETPYVAEFIVSLKKGREVNTEDAVNKRRMDLMKRSLIETKVQIEMLEAGADSRVIA